MATRPGSRNARARAWRSRAARRASSPARCASGRACRRPYLGGRLLDVTLEPEELVEPPHGLDRLRAKVLEANPQVAVPHLLLTEVRRPRVHGRPEGDRAGGLHPADPLRAEHGLPVLAQLLLVLGERHVAPVAHPVQEPELRHHRVEERQQVDAARLLPTPRGRILREVATVRLQSVGEIVDHRGADVLGQALELPTGYEVVDPAIRVGTQVERILVVVEVRADVHAAGADDAADDACAGAARRADHPRVERGEGVERVSWR